MENNTVISILCGIFLISLLDGVVQYILAGIILCLFLYDVLNPSNESTLNK